jgi:hypothetical protein
MSSNQKKSESPLDTLKNESARQRWELFHRAIAYAKESNKDSLLEEDTHSSEPESAAPILSIIR